MRPLDKLDIAVILLIVAALVTGGIAAYDPWPGLPYPGLQYQEPTLLERQQ